jgi:hypothetical protein
MEPRTTTSNRRARSEAAATGEIAQHVLFNEIVTGIRDIRETQTEHGELLAELSTRVGSLESRNKDTRTIWLGISGWIAAIVACFSSIHEWFAYGSK